jgi:TonB-dependent SusC/RagA subfamily outer membrane receptor
MGFKYGVIMLRKNVALIGAFIIAMIIAPTSSFAQERIEVSGKITNSETEQALAGVNIAVKGTSRGTSTDVDGEYSLSALPSDTLIFSFVGFETNQIPLQGRAQLDVELTPQAVTGEEMVVVAFSDQSRKSMTNSVSSVNSEAIAKVPSSNLANALPGQTPALATIQRTGQPGGDSPEIYIRGFGSLSPGRSQPIYVLDGVVVRDARSITQLDPDNFANVSVLKDAAATSVYGVEGANGAVVVET